MPPVGLRLEQARQLGGRHRAAEQEALGVLAAFALQERRRSIAEANAQLAKGIDAAAVAPFLGTFRNDALGEITLTLRGDRLVLDAGEFTGELRRLVSGPSDSSYVIVDPPLVGAAFQFRLDGSGDPTIVLPSPPDTYTFRKRGP